MFRWLTISLILAVLLLAGGPVSGRGVVFPGGHASIGLTAGLIPFTPDVPLPPLACILLDEICGSVFPVGSCEPLATIERFENRSATLLLKSNLSLGDAGGETLTPEALALSWGDRALKRWDAAWALRYVDGIDSVQNGLSGVRMVDERSFQINLRFDVSQPDLIRALTSPALRLTSGNPLNGVCAPFKMESASGDRSNLSGINSYHAGRPYLDSVSLVAYPSANESVLDFSRGSLDALLTASSELDLYAASSRSDISRVEKVGKALLVLLINPVRVPLPDERKSLALASDRDGIATVVLGGGAVPASDLRGSPAQPENLSANINQAKALYSALSASRDRLVLLVCDDPAAREAAGRLRANWESIGAPVEVRASCGPLMLSLEADAVLLAIRLPEGGEGALPQCLALYDRSAWWEPAALALAGQGELLRRVRALDPSASLTDLESAMMEGALAIPLVTYDILFAPGPDTALTPDFLYPGTALWRTYRLSEQQRRPE